MPYLIVNCLSAFYKKIRIGSYLLILFDIEQYCSVFSNPIPRDDITAAFDAWKKIKFWDYFWKLVPTGGKED